MTHGDRPATVAAAREDAAGGSVVAPDGAADAHPRGGLLQIGQVAERTGLSLRTIRFYEENGLVVPTARSGGGFRLYSDADVTRLEVVKRMKPLGFSLEEMRQLLSLLADLGARADDDRGLLLDRLQMFHAAATTRVAALRGQLAVAEEFAATLADHLQRSR
ncbi:MerR family transcriptional regulator [Geodermatophilus sp. SYSU D01119]